MKTFKTNRCQRRPKPVTCLSCGGVGLLVEKGPNGVPAWMCEAYPGCDSYVGVHPGTTFPLGTMAGPELRAERLKAHLWVDRLWRGKTAPTRKDVYGLVGAALGVRHFHIAQADLPLLNTLLTCRTAIVRALGREVGPAPASGLAISKGGPLRAEEVIGVIDIQLMDALFAGRRRRLWPTDAGGRAAAARGLAIGAITAQVDRAGRHWARLLR